MKPIRLSEHALRYTSKRGFTIAEIEETIRTSPWMPAELGRFDCRKNFLTSKNGTAKSMPPSKFARSSSRRLECRKRSLRSARAVNEVATQDINGANSCDHRYTWFPLTKTSKPVCISHLEIAIATSAQRFWRSVNTRVV
jgi:hypothetical protein